MEKSAKTTMSKTAGRTFLRLLLVQEMAHGAQEDLRESQNILKSFTFLYLP